MAATNIQIISVDYYDGNLVIVLAFWHGDKVTISVPLPEAVKRKIRGEK